MLVGMCLLGGGTIGIPGVQAKEEEVSLTHEHATNTLTASAMLVGSMTFVMTLFYLVIYFVYYS
jgi:hypothetical protein